MELPTTFTIASTGTPRLLASLSAASVSLVSPDWLMMMTRSFFSKIGSR